MKITLPVGQRFLWMWHHVPVGRRREDEVEGGRATRERMSLGWALAKSGFPMLGVGLAGLLTRGFSWGELGALVVIWAFFFLMLMAFSIEKQGY